MAAYSPEIATRARASLAKVRRLLPGALELVYDNYNALVIGFGPTERASEAIVSIALYPRNVNLFFLHGARLPDPDRLLQGSGSQVRRIALDDASILDQPSVQALVRRALVHAPAPFDPGQRRRLVIKSVSKTRRPRRPATPRRR
jgi:hypothetical protein